MSEWINVDLPLNKQDEEIKKSLIKELNIKAAKRPSLFKEFKKEFNLKDLTLKDLNHSYEYIHKEIKRYSEPCHFYYVNSYLDKFEIYFKDFDNKTFEDFAKDVKHKYDFWYGGFYYIDSLFKVGGKNSRSNHFFVKESLKDKKELFEVIKKIL